MQETLLYQNNTVKSSNRNYGIDLLRLISMLMVVVLHVLGKGGILKHSAPLTLRGEIIWSMEIACYCAVNLYAIISGYVGYKSKHKYSNLIYLCFQVIFFAILFTSIDLLISLYKGTPFSVKNKIFNLFPTIRNYWYFSAYFCLFFFMPLLNSIVRSTPRKTLKLFALFALIVICFWTQINDKVSNLAEGESVLWLAILYVVGAYISQYDPLKYWSAKKCFIFYILCISFTIFSKISIALVSIFLLGEPKFIGALIAYTSPTITLAAFFLFYACSKITFKHTTTKIITFFSPLAFGVYLVHCHPVTFSKMGNSFEWVTTKPITLEVLLIIAISLCIFIVCLFIDWIRLTLFKVLRIKQLSIWTERKFTTLIYFLFKSLHISLEDDSE